MIDLNLIWLGITTAMKTSFLWDMKNLFWRYLTKKFFLGYKMQDENKGYGFSLFDMLP